MTTTTTSTSSTSTTTTAVVARKTNQQQQQQQQQKHRRRSATTRQLIRDIRACQSNVSRAMELLETNGYSFKQRRKRKRSCNDNDNEHAKVEQQDQAHRLDVDVDVDEGPFLAALHVCGKAKCLSTALDLYYRHCPPSTNNRGSESCRALVIAICGRCGAYEEALKVLYHDHYNHGHDQPSSSSSSSPNNTQHGGNTNKVPSSSSSSSSFSFSSLTSLQQQRSVQSYNAAIAACGNAGAYQQALQVLETMPQHLVSTCTCNAVLTAFLKSKRGTDALQLLQRLKTRVRAPMTTKTPEADASPSSSWPSDTVTPDRNTYHLTVHALVREGNLGAAHTVFQEMKQYPHTFPKDSTYDVLITAFGKRKRWDMAQSLEQERQDLLSSNGNDNGDNDKVPAMTRATSTSKSTAAVAAIHDKNATRTTKTSEPSNITCSGTHGPAFEFWDMSSITKVGRGKYARWEFGTLVGFNNRVNNDNHPLTIAVHPHCNPAKNGISLLLLTPNGIKLGYVIMVNSATSNTSTLLGVYVDPDQRKHGLSKVFLALWMKLCLEANISLKTGLIHKPLLALVLQHTFGCIPQTGGVDVELSAGTTDKTIVLYSTSAKNLEGSFSPRDVKREGIEFSQTPTQPRGRKVRIGCAFASPEDKQLLVERIQTVLSGKDGNGKVSHNLSSHEVRRILLGEK